jgi:hypothetical protein
MANEIVGGITNLKPGNLDALRGPYSSVAAACAAIPNVIIDGRNFREGKTADIGTSVKSEAYTWQGGFEDINLLPVPYVKNTDNSGSFVLADAVGNVGLELTPAGLLRLSGIETATLKINGVSFVITDFLKSIDLAPVKTKTDTITVNSTGDFVLADALGNIGSVLTRLGVLKVNALETATLKLNGVTFSLADFIKTSDLTPIKAKTDSFLIDAAGDFILNDAAGNVGFKITSKGIGYLYKLILSQLQVGNSIFRDNDDWAFALDDFNRNLGFGVTKGGIIVAKGVKIPGLENINLKFPKSNWVGKTILWLGTSIPNSSEYPERACAQNGATCINNAMGSSPIRASKIDGGYTGLDYANYAYGLTQTYAEKNYFIANYATIKTGLQNAPATLSATEQTNIINSSYEYKVLRYLNGTLPMPDLWVLDHGYNDANFPDDDATFQTIPAVYNDKRYFIGAYNFIISLILQYNPHQRIAISGHYENQYRPRIVKAQQIVADYWQIPILKLHEKTMWSQKLIPGTAALWSQSPYLEWSAGQDTTKDMTALRVWLPDALHPRTDPTNRAQTLLSEIEGKWLNDLN